MPQPAAGATRPMSPFRTSGALRNVRIRGSRQGSSARKSDVPLPGGLHHDADTPEGNGHMDPTLSDRPAAITGGSRGIGSDAAEDSVAEDAMTAVAVRGREHSENAAPGARRRQPSDHRDRLASTPSESGNSVLPAPRLTGSGPSAAAWSASDSSPGSQIRTPDQHGPT